MFAGPIYYPQYYEKYCILTIGYLALRSSMTFIWTFVGFLKAKLLLHRYEQQNNTDAAYLIDKADPNNI
jgi:hypothetical protein